MQIFNTDRLVRWLLIVKYYGPDIEYIKGEKNIVTDALSIFPSIWESREYTGVHLLKVNCVRNK